MVYVILKQEHFLAVSESQLSYWKSIRNISSGDRVAKHMFSSQKYVCWGCFITDKLGKGVGGKGLSVPQFPYMEDERILF